MSYKKENPDVIQSIEQELVLLKQKPKQLNIVRVKFEYNKEKRCLEVHRPLKFQDLLNKAKTAYGLPATMQVHMRFTTHEINSSIIIPIDSQTDLDQAVELVDRNPNSKSLRICLEALNSGMRVMSNAELYDTAIRNKYPSASRSLSTPQVVGGSPGSETKRHSTPALGSRESPPPGYVPPDYPLHQTSDRDEFIPETHEDHEYIINSPQGSSTSLDKVGGPYRGSVSLGSASGARLKSSISHEDFTDSNYGHYREGNKGSTFPSRGNSTKFAPADYTDGRRTFPSRVTSRPRLSTSIIGNETSPHGSEISFQTGSSESSGIGIDLASDVGRPRRDDMEVISRIEEIKIGDNAKSPRAPVNWSKGKLLGQGAFGVVYLCYDKDTGRELAVKQVNLNGNHDEARKEVGALKYEIELLRNINHERIVQYFGCHEDSNTLSIFMEFMPGGSLKDVIKSYGALTEPVTRKYTRQILEGVSFLHASHIVHRDIKGANILRDSMGNVKLADFGASKRLQTICTAVTGMKTVTGTPYWMSPEIINGEGYGRKADVWSIGCTVVEMLTTKPPWAEFEAMAAIFKIATQPTNPTLPGHVSNDAKDFLRCTFQESPKERPLAVQLLSHRFVSQFNME
ncbi:mitogen-activated protein kinase kinase kinase 2-like isoform X2 [Anneissia japonica]|uniref:mitogen-activated protein kinase kinase kinase 2-like isoform X2 n=1 Tax=Anneissia japonica TaxID=1529436 RepID=UPI001425790A|nr:mitogen-activated protein kinase kinase kinase 2-like isoform X2 [Anneissia japonica]